MAAQIHGRDVAASGSTSPLTHMLSSQTRPVALFSLRAGSGAAPA